MQAFLLVFTNLICHWFQDFHWMANKAQRDFFTSQIIWYKKKNICSNYTHGLSYTVQIGSSKTEFTNNFGCPLYWGRITCSTVLGDLGRSHWHSWMEHVETSLVEAREAWNSSWTGGLVKLSLSSLLSKQQVQCSFLLCTSSLTLWNVKNKNRKEISKRPLLWKKHS